MRTGRRTMTGWLTLVIAAFSSLGAGGMAVANATVDSTANTMADATEPPTRTFDLSELTAGEAPTEPWLADGVIRTPDVDIPVDPDLDLTTFASIGGANVVAIDDTSGDGMNNRLVRIDRDGTTEYAAGPVTRPFVLSADRERIAWTEWDGDTGRLVLADAETGDVLRKRPIGAETYTIGFVRDSVLLRPANGGAARVWTPGKGIANIRGTENATATDARRGLASVVTGYEQDPDTGDLLACSTVVDTTADNEELWGSCDVAVVSFSPDGRHVWAKDTRTDDAMPSSMFLLDARTGDQLLHLDLDDGTTQRVNWESEDSVLLDVWDEERTALVRCELAVDGACELATEPVAHQDPVLEPPMPYLLGNQP